MVVGGVPVGGVPVGVGTGAVGWPPAPTVVRIMQKLDSLLAGEFASFIQRGWMLFGGKIPSLHLCVCN